MTPWSVIRLEPMPFGKKPSCDQRLETVAVSPASEKPRVSTPRPMTIMPMMAVTLIIENQNSTSPKILTEIRLTPKSTTRNTRALTHCGISGNQKWM